MFLVVGWVLTVLFDDKTGTAADDSMDVSLALWALGKWSLFNGLSLFKMVAAGVAFVLICRHVNKLLSLEIWIHWIP